jgi:tetratricopeptide (TPR) repeat protein
MADHWADGVAAIPWKDRPGDDSTSTAAAPRSERDIAILRSLIRRIPANDAGAHNNLGVVFYSKGLFADAAEQFERALELDPRMQVAERNLQIVYFGTDHFDNSLRELRQILEIDPADLEARAQLARMYLLGGDASAAARELRALLAVRPMDSRLLGWLGRAEMRLGDLDAALLVLKQGADAEPRDARIRMQLGEVLYLRGMAAEARDWLERALALDDTIAEAHHLLAFVCGELGDNASAHRHSARAIELNPGYAKADRSLSLDRYSEARYEELVGERGARPAVAVGGGLVHYSLGLALRQKGLYDDALIEFRRALERGEDRYLVRQAQAEMLLLRGSSMEAVALYGELIEEEPASPKLWNELGVASHQAGRLAEAQDAYGRAITLDPKYALAWNNLGVVRHHRGEAGTRDAFESALRTGRAVSQAWRNLGWLQHLQKDWSGAEDAYRKALAAESRLASAWTGLGMLFLEQGHVDQARNALARAVESDPDLPEAHYHYAFALSAAGDYPAALRETSRALELNPYITLPRFQLLIDLQFEDAAVPAPELGAPERVPAGATIDTFDFEPEALEILELEPEPESTPGVAPLSPSAPASIEALVTARAELNSGHFPEATAAVHRAASLGANRLETNLLHGEIHLASGAAGEALDRFQSVLDEVDRIESAEDAGVDVIDVRLRALTGLTLSNQELGRSARAVELAEQWLSLSPGDSRAAIALADALEAAGEPARAVAAIEAMLVNAPGDLRLLTRLGAAYVANGELDRAEPALRGALARGGPPAAAHAALGRLLTAAGRSGEAVAEFHAALDAIPTFAEAAIGLADLHAEEGRLDDATTVLANFLELDPYHFQALVRLGDVLWQAGRQTEAGVAYRRVLHFDPSHSEALHGLERLEPAESWPVAV